MEIFTCSTSISKWWADRKLYVNEEQEVMKEKIIIQAEVIKIVDKEMETSWKQREPLTKKIKIKKKSKKN
jgi:hypothetical protein